jgi:sugar/nucleoside kinase (ribokinase family)
VTRTTIGAPGDLSVEEAPIGRALSMALDTGTRLAVVTRGARGVMWQAAAQLPTDPQSWSAEGSRKGKARGLARSVTIRPREAGDPTGCGDVWGAAMFARLLAGDGLEASIRTANRLAGRNLEHQGAEGLYEILRSEVKS